jgi:hypothetical protein
MNRRQHHDHRHGGIPKKYITNIGNPGRPVFYRLQKP